MTIVCAQCKKTMGEKCPRCGSAELALAGIARARPLVHACTSCYAEFKTGEGGTSHGICEECYANLEVE